MDERILEFGRERLGGRPVPDDLAILLEAQWSGNDGPLSALEIRFFAPGQTNTLIDHSYLNDRDRANPDTMANVAAIDQVNQYIGFVAEGLNGAALGYWLHPEEPADRPAPIVSFDTEGEYELLNGAYFAEAVVGKWVFDDDEWFGRLADGFEVLGVAMPVRRWPTSSGRTLWLTRLNYTNGSTTPSGLLGVSAEPEGQRSDAVHDGAVGVLSH
jgi:hypothetical protein